MALRAMGFALAFAALLTVQSANGWAIERLPNPAIPSDSGAFSRLQLSGSTYLIRDKDYNPQLSESGVFTTWLYRPQDTAFLVRARYCVPELSVTTAPPAVLESIALLGDNSQLLARIDRQIGTSPAQAAVVRPGYYERSPLAARPYWGWYGPWWAWDAYSPPIYHPPAHCAVGGATFDLNPVAGRLARLPNQTLKMQLVFSDGQTSNWHLGGETIRELKQMLALRGRGPVTGQAPRYPSNRRPGSN